VTNGLMRAESTSDSADQDAARYQEISNAGGPTLTGSAAPFSARPT
jgi:hypothetical protein